ncbi:biopolymer transporter ExbD [Pelomonas sp. HMWF004]|nr:biopolymer transporter ExbD [Pelomonas sp. HMWF004]
MGMTVASLSGAEPEALMDVNTTPLIDVMLVLLVMLILTIPVQLHSITMELGGKPISAKQQPVVHEVAIDFDGAVSWDGQILAGPAALDDKMREAGALTLADQPEVHIRPHKLADYSAVTAVLAAVQRNGVRKMGVVGNEQYRE